MIQNNFRSLVGEHHSDGYVFMQHGAPCHTANVMKVWYHYDNVEVLEWPAYCPDLNPIDNL